MSSHITNFGFITGMVTPEEGRGKGDSHARPWKSGAFSAAFGFVDRMGFSPGVRFAGATAKNDHGG